jgi:4-hydroxy-tetrahydrodipicolinate synthase
MQTVNQFGLSCALALPCNKDSGIDYTRLTTHARRSLEAGCSSVTVFGTTGEGPSVSLTEREQILGALLAAGINLQQQVIGGVAAASVGDAVDQARMLIDRGCRGVLLAPPFYFKNVTDEGLYRWFSQVCEKIGQRARDVFLYHIPSVTQAALSIELIGRLKAAYPKVVVGVKDSGGDWVYTEKLLRTHANLILLIGDERHLAAGIRLGAQGAISGLANVCPEILLKLIETGEDDPRIIELVNEILKFPVTPAVKALIAHRRNDSVWLSVRPPLVALSEDQAGHLAHAYDTLTSPKGIHENAQT